MNQSPTTAAVPAGPLSASAESLPRIAVMSSSWHREIVLQSRDAALQEFERQHLPRSQVDLFDVPGAFEMPLLAQRLARSGRYQAIVPVLSAVLTPRDFHEHVDHLQFFSAHFAKKGAEVARACLDTLAGLRALDLAQTG